MCCKKRQRWGQGSRGHSREDGRSGLGRQADHDGAVGGGKSSGSELGVVQNSLPAKSVGAQHYARCREIKEEDRIPALKNL